MTRPAPCGLVVRIADEGEADAARAAGAGGWLAALPRQPLLVRFADGGTLALVEPGEPAPPAEPCFVRLADLPGEGDWERLAASDLAGLLVDTGPERLLDRFAFSTLARFVSRCRERGLEVAFAGGLEPPDMPRLAPLRPRFLLASAEVRGKGGEFDAAACRALCAALAPPAPARAFTGEPDRVFIRDLVQEVEIGAYGSEHGRRQRVSFSIEGEIVPPGREPMLADIYSYDRMMDSVRALVAGEREALVETLAERLAAELLEDPRLLAVRIRVEKLDLGPRAAGIEIYRKRPG